MSKYHISKSGNPAPCKATKGNCPLGKHFKTEEQAYQHVQKEMSKEFSLLRPINYNYLEKEYDKKKNMISNASFKDREDEERQRTELAQLAQRINPKVVEEVNLSKALKEISTPDSGATLAINEDGVSASVPVVGFCASPYPEHSVVFDSAKNLTFDSLIEFEREVIEKDKGIFSQEDVYIGLWNDPSTGKVYLDVSKRYDTAEEARKACEEKDQIAYFDLQMMESVDVDRNATSGQKEAVS